MQGRLKEIFLIKYEITSFDCILNAEGDRLEDT
jgi:hypothetical protein